MRDSTVEAVKNFRGVEHRIEFISAANNSHFNTSTAYGLTKVTLDNDLNYASRPLDEAETRAIYGVLADDILAKIEAEDIEKKPQ